MKTGIKCFIALVMIAMTSLCVSATDTTTKFKTGPFTVSVDLGMQCNDLNISEPVQEESLSGDSYTIYSATACDASIVFLGYNTPQNWRSDFGADIVRSELIKIGADKDTISVYDRTVNGKSGAVGSGYMPISQMSFYEAGFYISPKSLCWIKIWDNQTKMISALKTIKITETA